MTMFCQRISGYDYIKCQITIMQCASFLQNPIPLTNLLLAVLQGKLVNIHEDNAT